MVVSLLSRKPSPEVEYEFDHYMDDDVPKDERVMDAVIDADHDEATIPAADIAASLASDEGSAKEGEPRNSPSSHSLFALRMKGKDLWDKVFPLH